MLEDDPDKALLKRAYSLETESETRALYRDWAASYDKTMLAGLKYLTPAKTAALLADTVEDKDASVVDVGCGTGLAGGHLAALGFSSIDGLDYSKQMLAQARNRTCNGKPVYGQLTEADLNSSLPLPDHHYRHMICTGTFTHAHVGARALHELFRILQPGGIFACTVHKDVWGPAGFSSIVAELEQSGAIATRYREPGTYFETDSEPQGWYILWEKRR